MYFSELGEAWILRKDMRSLYGSRRVKRLMIYGTSSSKRLTSKRIKSLIISAPSMSTALRLHSLRCNFVAKIWKNSDVCTLQEPPITNHGWTGEREIQWIEKAFLDDIEQLLSEGSDGTYFEENRFRKL